MTRKIKGKKERDDLSKGECLNSSISIRSPRSSVHLHVLIVVLPILFTSIPPVMYTPPLNTPTPSLMEIASSCTGYLYMENVLHFILSFPLLSLVCLSFCTRKAKRPIFPTLTHRSCRSVYTARGPTDCPTRPTPAGHDRARRTQSGHNFDETPPPSSGALCCLGPPKTRCRTCTLSPPPTPSPHTARPSAPSGKRRHVSTSGPPCVL